MSHDRYAHLRANLARHRTMTAARDAIAWCRSCERHHADSSGLCPVCQSPEAFAPVGHLATPTHGRVGDDRAA